MKLHKLTQSVFCRELSEDTLNTHYLLANPSAYGISFEAAKLPVYSKENISVSKQQLENDLKQLKSIHTSFLSIENRNLVSLLLSHVDEQLDNYKYPYHSEPFAPSSGIQSQLPILLAEYAFRSRQDVEQYLSLLKQIPPYLDGLIQFEKEKSKAGLFMADFSADKVIEQCNQIMDSRLLENKQHFLDTTFFERLKELSKSEAISKSEQDTYILENHNLLINCVLPAYESLAKEMSLLKGSGRNEMGLMHIQNGREYYTLLLKQTTGSSASIKRLKKNLTKQFAKDAASLAELIRRNPALLTAASETDFPLHKPGEMIQDLKKRMHSDFPVFPNSDCAPDCYIKSVSKNLEKYTAPAFYLTPPLDDISKNTIYINHQNTSEGLELYTTLAHEGYPGHLFQTVFYHLYQHQENINPIRNLLYYGGYLEGWALYVEMYSYNYCKELLTEHNISETSQILYDIEQLNRSLQLCLYSLLDLSIHYDGADYPAVHSILSGYGITDPETTRSIYEYIVEEPANYPKYYIGYLEILSLKNKAVQEWGSEYTDQRFHDILLKSGPAPFSLLDEWIFQK